MDNLLSAEGMAALYERAQKEGQDLSYMFEVADRRDRWKHLFDPKTVKHEVDKEFVDIEKDPVLDHYQVSARERQRRRWQTEFVLDNMRRQAEFEGLGGPLHETTNVSNIAAFTTWALPLVRKYLPRQFLQQIVPTYPMSQPTGFLFTADTTYGSGGSYASGTSIFGSPDSTFADDPGECGTPNQLDFNISSSSIAAISKKLQGAWSIEAAQNLASYHKLVMENEVVKMLGVEIEREINRYGINQIVAAVPTITNWNSNQPMAGTNGWSNATPKQYEETLWDAIEDGNKAIKDAQFVNANFILSGTTFASRLRKLNGYRMLNTGDALQNDVVTGPNMFGSLESRYVLYEDVDFPADKALIGHKPSEWKHTGAAYLPFVPVWRTPVIHNVTMCPAVGYLTRFAFRVINSNFYGMVVVN